MSGQTLNFIHHFSTVQRAKLDADERGKREEKQKNPRQSASIRVFRVLFLEMYGSESTIIFQRI
jgi:hypothetical protein